MTFYRKLALFLCLAATSWALPIGSAHAASDIKAGSITSSPPFISYASDGKTLQGIIVDLAAAMSEHMDRKIVFEQIPFSGLIPALRAGRINIVFSVMNDTPERQKLIDFVDFFDLSSALLIRHDNPEHVTGVDSLCGKKIATVRGSYQIAIVDDASKKCEAENKPAIINNQYNTPAEGRLQVQTGNAAAFFGGTPVLKYIAQTVSNGETFSVAPKEYAPVPLGIGIEKADTKLRDQLQSTLQSLIDDGTYLKILEKYHLQSALPKEATINDAK